MEKIEEGQWIVQGHSEEMKLKLTMRRRQHVKSWGGLPGRGGTHAQILRQN